MTSRARPADRPRPRRRRRSPDVGPPVAGARVDRPGRPLRRPRLWRDPAADRAVVAPRRPARPARRAGAGPGAPGRGVDGGGDRGRGGPRPVRAPSRRSCSWRPAARCSATARLRSGRSGTRRSRRSIAATSMALSRSTSGPGSTARARPPDAVDPEVRAFVGRMQREAFELPEWDPEHATRSTS